MSSVRLGILSDLHRTIDAGQRSQFHNEYDFQGHTARIDRALPWLSREAIDALILCGDLTHSAQPEAMSAVLRECCAELDVPVIVVAGNHDVGAGEDELARAIIERAGDNRLLAGDPAGHLISGIRVAGLQLAPTSGWTRSRLLSLPAVEEWGEEPVVLISHLPLLSAASAVAAAGLPYPGDLLDREEAAALLRSRSAATIVVSGHLHVREVLAEGPVLQLLQAAMIEPPFEVGVLDVRTDADGAVSVTRRAHRCSDRQATYEPTFTDAVGSWRFARVSWEATDAVGDLEGQRVLTRPMTVNRSQGRILTTHTGSLPRPDRLPRQLAAFDRGSLTEAELATLAEQVHAAVRQLVARQVEVGIDVVSDGEVSKFSYATYVKQRLTGFEGENTLLSLSEFADFPRLDANVTATVSNPSCTGPVTFRGANAVATDIENLKTVIQATPRVEGFLNAASPGIIADYFRNEHYKSDEEYLWALADAMKPEYDMIAESGLLLQVDCPDLALGRHFAPKPLDVDAFRKRASQRVEALNHALRDIRPDRTRMHVCWGNYPSPHHHDIPLSEIADIVLRARPAALLIEAANPRHSHEWRVFEDITLPAGKVIVPGVIDTLTPYIEHPRVVADRILRYAKVVGPERVIAGTDCGFATSADSTTVDPDVVWAKLRALTEGAEIASREIWPSQPTAGRRVPSCGAGARLSGTGAKERGEVVR